MRPEIKHLIDKASIRPADEIKSDLTRWLAVYAKCTDPIQKDRLRHVILGIEYVLQIREFQEI